MVTIVFVNCKLVVLALLESDTEIATPMNSNFIQTIELRKQAAFSNVHAKFEVQMDLNVEGCLHKLGDIEV
jgi:hypothetical protein